MSRRQCVRRRLTAHTIGPSGVGQHVTITCPARLRHYLNSFGHSVPKLIFGDHLIRYCHQDPRF
jgi:hypothetical protein